MEVEIILPDARRAPLEEVVAFLSEPSPPLRPFAESTVTLCAELSRAIFRDREARLFPELLALAFWMRRAELLTLKSQFDQASQPEAVRVPRGTVLHFPPSNVDTMFLYSWLLAVLTGNRNCIRISLRRTVQTDILLRLLDECLHRWDGEAQRNTIVVSYSHNAKITGALSKICDVRVIWGGDQTVELIRSVPLAVHARDISFPDRSSLALIRTGAYLCLSENEKEKLAEQFSNDSYWYQQMACSSPRLLVWCGPAAETNEAAERFWSALDLCLARRGYEAPAAVHMKKLVFSCQSIIDLPVSEYRRSRDVTVLKLDSLTNYTRAHSGGGLFFTARVDQPTDLIQYLERKDQTLTYFGFSGIELNDLAKSVGSKAIDRIVPIGQALKFSRFWDGYDLLHEFCRFVHIPHSAGDCDDTSHSVVTDRR